MAIKPIKVGQINSYIKRILQTDPLLGNVSVIGEISNLKYHNTGHVYFTLKDETSKINCFMPYDKVLNLRYELEDGMEITAYGYISLFERNGTYSLNIKEIDITGKGDLSIAFDKLKAKLEDEGLFSPLLKKPIPTFPKKIALVTSETGAALQDMLKIIQGRNNIVDIIIFPVTVQGPKAAPEISSTISFINENYKDVDIMIVGRGGGSIEELWAFNEESVARSIARSRIPVISAVGHETDITICDFVADLRAETPTAAAAIAVPNIFEIRENIEGKKRKMLIALKSKVDQMENLINLRKMRLDGLNPTKILSKGYGAILNKDRNRLISINDIDENEVVTIILNDGEFEATVTKVKRRTI
ncbi:MAG: exodeoxyribonuclease VII large subunit [Anaerovoracaceae bacterium]